MGGGLGGGGLDPGLQKAEGQARSATAVTGGVPSGGGSEAPRNHWTVCTQRLPLPAPSPLPVHSQPGKKWGPGLNSPSLQPSAVAPDCCPWPGLTFGPCEGWGGPAGQLPSHVPFEHAAACGPGPAHTARPARHSLLLSALSPRTAPLQARGLPLPPVGIFDASSAS